MLPLHKLTKSQTRKEQKTKKSKKKAELIMFLRVWDAILEVGLTARDTRSLIWAAHQRFFLHMILAIKVADAVSVVRTELARGCAVVIGLFSTGEALVGEEKDSSDGDELFSAPQQILLNLVSHRTMNLLVFWLMFNLPLPSLSTSLHRWIRFSSHRRYRRRLLELKQFSSVTSKHCTFPRIL